MPRGWCHATLPDLISSDGVLTDGDWVESKDQDPNGRVRLTQLADIGDGTFRDRSNRYLTEANASELRCTFLQRGDVLIARMPDPLGRACLFPGADRPCVTVVDVCIVRPGFDGVDPRWLMHVVNAPATRRAISLLQAGSTRKRISKANLSTIRLPVAPSNEQRRIVAAIDSYFSRLDDAVATLGRVQRNLERYRASVLKAAVEGRLVWTEAELARKEGRSYEPASELVKRILAERRHRWEETEFAKLKAKGQPPKDDRWKAKYEEPVAPITDGLPTLPEGWCWTTVDQITAGDRSAAYGVLVPGPDVADGVPLVRVGDIDDRRIATRGIKRIDRSIADQFARTYLRGGELLLTLVGTIGRTAIVPHALAGANVARAVGVIPASSLLVVQWLAVWFDEPSVRLRMVGLAHEVARKTLNLEDVRTAVVALPPAAEQARIASFVDDLDSIALKAREESKATLARVGSLRQSALAWAFYGRLVDQDATDEPASVLLERIRAEHSAMKPTTPTRARRRKERVR
jgi:type I restriction enzyme S subunit